MRLIDAGVWIAIADPQDRYHAAAHAIVAEVEQPLAVLDLTFYEVANVMGPRREGHGRGALS